MSGSCEPKWLRTVRRAIEDLGTRPDNPAQHRNALSDFGEADRANFLRADGNACDCGPDERELGPDSNEHNSLISNPFPGSPAFPANKADFSHPDPVELGNGNGLPTSRHGASKLPSFLRDDRDDREQRQISEHFHRLVQRCPFPDREILIGTIGNTPEAIADHLEERAAILQFDADVARETAQQLAIADLLTLILSDRA